MASVSTMISFIVLLLASYSSSAPLVPELQNATSVPQVENATSAFPINNLIVLARRETVEDRSVKDAVGLSSSSSEDHSDSTAQTTQKVALRETNDDSLAAIGESNNEEREIDDDVNAFSGENSNEERSFTEESLTTEVNTKSGVKVNSFKSSTVNKTTVEPTDEVKNVKRGGSWLSDESDRTKRGGSWLSDESDRTKRSANGGSWLSDESDRTKRGGSWLSDESDRMKRSANGGSWLSDESDRTKRGGSWLSDESDRTKRGGSWLSDESDRMKRGASGGSWLSGDSNDEVRKRSIEDVTVSTIRNATSTVEISSVPTTIKTIKTRETMDQSPSLSAEASEEFNRRAIGPVELEESSTMIAQRIQLQLTTDEQPSSSTEVVRGEMSSTFEPATTVTPMVDFTRATPVPSESKSKILAIIPGQISKSQLVINPATGKTAGFRPVHQIQLSEGQNETVTQETKPSY